MKLKGQRVTVRDMEEADLAEMSRWRPFVDPLYQPFDFPRRSYAEHVRWFNWRNNDRSRRQYTIEDAQGRVIGSLTLREIDGRRSARLGITLGADYVSQGYGSEALRTFLDYYFGDMGFSRMVLDVASTNQRAVRTYLSLGFKRMAERYRHAGHSSYRVLQTEPRYRHLRSNFRRQGTNQMVLFHDMVLTREEWWAIRHRTEPEKLEDPVS